MTKIMLEEERLLIHAIVAVQRQFREIGAQINTQLELGEAAQAQQSHIDGIVAVPASSEPVGLDAVCDAVCNDCPRDSCILDSGNRFTVCPICQYKMQL